MPITFTYLNELSASDGYYALDNTAPVITIDSTIPANKINPVHILVNASIFDEGGFTLSGLSVSGSVSPISGFSTVGSYSTFSFYVTATGNIQISATDIAGNSSTLLSTGYTISASSTDKTPPVIEFLTEYPVGKYITSAELNGSVHVRVTDETSIAATSANFVLTEDSVGTIGPLTQISPNIVEFDIFVYNTGTITLSARDDSGNSVTGQNGPWISDCGTGKRINLTNFLPSHLKESEMFEFTQFFENFLNTMYEDKLRGCNYSILEKIDRLKNFKNSDAVDAEYFQYFANHFGYEIDINRDTIGEFSQNGTDEEINEYIRLSLKNIPSFNKIKTTENAIQVVLFSFGIIAELIYLWTNDYETNWRQEVRTDKINVSDEIPKTTLPYYPTSHFRIGVNYTKTLPSWTNNYDNVIKIINNIRSINTVLRGLSGYFDPVIQLPSDPIALGYCFSVNYCGEIEAPWVGDPGSYIEPLNQFIDSRDGEVYKTVTINGVTWMAENLRYNTPSYNNGGAYTSLSMAPDNNPALIPIYGRWYNQHDAAVAVPAGWHLPTKAEYDALISYVGTNRNDYCSTTGWATENGNNNSGFNAFPAAWSVQWYLPNSPVPSYFTKAANFWTSTQTGGVWYYIFSILETIIDVPSALYYPNTNDWFCSVRCVKD